MQAVIDKIMEAKSVAVLTHLNEDPDTIGSCFAFAKVMRKLGKGADGYRICRCRHRAEPPMDGVTVCRSGYQSVIHSYGHTVARTERGCFPTERGK